MIDLDGTLLDTIPDLAAAANGMLTELGMPVLSESTIRNYVGKGIANLIERTLTNSMDGKPDPALFERAVPVYERTYREANGKHTTMYPGVKEGLDLLRAQQCRLAILIQFSYNTKSLYPASMPPCEFG